MLRRKKKPYRNGEVVNLSVQKNKAQKYDQSTESIGSRTFWVYNCVSIVKLWFLNLQLSYCEFCMYTHVHFPESRLTSFAV